MNMYRWTAIGLLGLAIFATSSETVMAKGDADNSTTVQGTVGIDPAQNTVGVDPSQNDVDANITGGTVDVGNLPAVQVIVIDSYEPFTVNEVTPIAAGPGGGIALFGDANTTPLELIRIDVSILFDGADQCTYQVRDDAGDGIYFSHTAFNSETTHQTFNPPILYPAGTDPKRYFSVVGGTQCLFDEVWVFRVP